VKSKKRNLRVSASPFNAVKLELAIVLVGGVLVWMMQESWLSHPLSQIMILLSYGIIAMLWISWRTRNVQKRMYSSSSSTDNAVNIDQYQKEP